MSEDDDITRVTVISPVRRVDLALPGSATLVELLPNVLRFSGLDANTPTEAVHGWVLQRLGSDPFDPYVTVSKLNIRDGETLHLRQRRDAIPDAAFDDMVDAVATATNSRPAWTPQHSRRTGLTLLVAMLVGVPLFLLWRSLGVAESAPLLTVVGFSAFVAFASSIGAIALSRAAGEAHVSAALSWSAVVLSAATGWVLPQLVSSTPVDKPLRVLVAGALVLAVATICALAVRVQTMGFFTVAVFAGLLVVVSAVMALLPGRDAAVAAVAMAVLVLVTAYLPTLSYQLARIALPNLPATSEAILADDTPVQSDIVSRAIFADKVLGALLAATTATAAWLTFDVLTRPSIWALLYCGVIGLAFMLRARAFVGFGSRAALLVSGLVITAQVLLAASARVPNSVLAVAITLVAFLVLSYVLAHYSAATYAKILSPTWGRWGDVFEWLAIMAIIPLLLGVLNLYARFLVMFVN